MDFEGSDSAMFSFSALARRPSLAPFHAIPTIDDQSFNGPVLADINRRPSDDPRTRAVRARISPMLLHPPVPVYFDQQPYDAKTALAEVEALYAEFFEPQQPLSPEPDQDDAKDTVMEEQQWAQYTFGARPTANAFIATSPPPPLDFSTASPVIEPMPCSPVFSQSSQASNTEITKWKMYEPTAHTFYTPQSPAVVPSSFSSRSPASMQFDLSTQAEGINPSAITPINIPTIPAFSRPASPNVTNAPSPAGSLDDEDHRLMQRRVIPSISGYRRLHGRGHKRDLSTMSVASEDGMGSGTSSAGLTPLMQNALLGLPAPVAGEKRKRAAGDKDNHDDMVESETATRCAQPSLKKEAKVAPPEPIQTHYHVFSIHSPQIHFSDSTPLLVTGRSGTRTPDVDSAEDSDAFVPAAHSDDDDDDFRPAAPNGIFRGAKKLKNARQTKRPRTNSPPTGNTTPITVDYEISDYLMPGTTSCPICGHEPSGSRLSDLRRHMQTHKKEGQRRMWACRKCSRVVKDKDGKVVKVMGHSAFVRCDSLKRHWGREHVEEWDQATCAIVIDQ